VARFADLLVGSGFAVGVCRYEEVYPGYEQSPRIVIPVLVEGQLTVPAIVDTGAPWCILDPEIARAVGIQPGTGYRAETLLFHWTEYEGVLHRMRVGLFAEQGDDLEIEATVFVPALHPGDTWASPNFLGLSGLLERTRFAVDPSENAFYFGLI
jgi:hypothetical protein